MTHSEYADGLRRIADWYEEHPDVPLPEAQLTVYAVRDTRETVAQIARALGTARKEFAEHADLMFLVRDFGGVTLRFCFTRQTVCTRRVIGARFIPARPGEPEREVEVIEWDCEPILSHEEGGEA
mgnify:CR=1 FL=1